MNIEQKAITLIKEIEKRHHTPGKVVGSSSFEQELMEEKVELVKQAFTSISNRTFWIIAITQIITITIISLMK